MKLNNISGLRYYFIVRFSIGLVYNKVKGKHILLNSLKNATGLFNSSKWEAVFDRYQVTIFLKENVPVLINRICVYFLTQKQQHIVC